MCVEVGKNIRYVWIKMEVMIVKNGEENYYFWPVGFGLDGSLEECAGDRHYMNKVCIERTKQLWRSGIVIDFT